MKKWLLPFLALILVGVLLLCLSFCNKEEETDYTGLLNSFSVIEEASGYSLDYHKSDDTTDFDGKFLRWALFWVFRQDDGSDKFGYNLSTVEGDSTIYRPSYRSLGYFTGKKGYSQMDHLYELDGPGTLHPVALHYSETGFSADDMIRSYLHIDFSVIKAFLSAFADMKPDRITDTFYQLDNITLSQYTTVKNLLSSRNEHEDTYKKQLEAMGNPGVTLKVSFGEVDWQLTIYWNNVTDGNEIKQIREVYSYTNWRSLDNPPDFVTEIADNTMTHNSEVVYWEDGLAATYRYIANEGETPYMQFEGLGRFSSDNASLESYTVRDTVEGIPVRKLTGTHYNPNSDITVARMIVPAGVSFGFIPKGTAFGRRYPSDLTIFYLHDTEAAVASGTIVPGEQVRDVHYAGQWEMKNGLPEAIGN